MAKPGPKKKPTEAKRRRGNPGKRTLPEPETALAPAVTVGEVPAPLRALATAGTAEWELIWREAFAWLSASDLVAVQAYCESVDDYVIVRSRMLAAQADPALNETQVWRLRKQVHDAAKLRNELGGVIGLGPSHRADIGVAEVRIVEGLVDLMERDQKPARMTTDFIDAEVVDDDD